IRDNCPSIADLTPQTSLGATIEYHDEKRDGVTITGIWPGWHSIERREILQGRPFTTLDEQDARQVCLVNDKAIDELKLKTDPTGDYMLIRGRRFQIVGVVETLQSQMFGHGTTSSEVFIPFSTAVKLQDDEDYFFFIVCKVKSPEVAEEAKAEAKFVLRHTRHLEP